MRLLLTLVVVLAFVAVSPANAQDPGPADNFAPRTDDDIAALGAAVAAVPRSAGICDRYSCTGYSCASMVSLHKALATAAGAVGVVLPALRAATAEYKKLLDKFQAEYERSVDDTLKRRYVRAASDALLKTAKLLLDVASVASAVQSIPELSMKFGKSQSAEDLLRFTQYIDALIEAQTGTLNVVDDLTQTLADQPTLTEEVAKALTIKSAISDATGALVLFRDGLKELKEAAASGNKVALEKAAESFKSGVLFGGVAQLTAKLGTFVAEQQLKELARQISENIRNQAALNKAWESNYKSYARLLERQVALIKLTPLLTAAVERVAPCAVRCEPHSVADPRVNGMSYGEILKRYNPVVALSGPAVRDALASLAFAPGTPPVIAALPAAIAPRDGATARYSLASCPATEGAVVRLLARNGAATDLGEASPGAEVRLSFAAPSVEGDYDLRIVDRRAAAIAQTSLTVEKAKPEETLACGITLAKGVAAPNGHLVGKSFDFVLGTPGTEYYLSATMTVSPGIGCRGDGFVAFPVFGGVSKEPEFFQLKVLAGDPAIAKYFEQWVGPVTVGFDNGVVPSSSFDLLQGVEIPEGAKRVDFVKLHVEQGSANLDLVWGVE